MALPAAKDRYTFADVLAWDDGERAELIDGEVFLMAPAPSRTHQKVSGEIFRQVANYLEGKKFEVYHPPFDVRLFEKDGDAPVDTVVEILSPSTQRHDRLVKLGLNQRAGVTAPRPFHMVPNIFDTGKDNPLEHDVPGGYTMSMDSWYRNVFSVVPRSKVKLVAKMLKVIHAQESKKAAREKAKPGLPSCVR